MKKNRRPLLVVTAAIVFFAAVGWPSSAGACGGFFCAQTPIAQSGETILFSIGDSGVRAYIQIQYQGKADDFAWVVPVMSPPIKVSVGVQQVFTTLMNATAPQFRVNWNLNDGGRCSTRGFTGVAIPSGENSSAGPVLVIDKGEVGPYSYVVVAAADSEKLTLWLDGNGFVQPPSAKSALAHYIVQGFVFVAIKLKRGAEVGEIQPLVLDMGHPEICVPLVLTSIAAVPNMPIYTLVLGEHRAVPRNWFHVELNLRRIDWLSNGQNYLPLVISAINEAAGRAFVTEFAGNTARFRRQLWAPELYDLTRLQGITNPATFVTNLLRLGLPPDPIIQSLLRKYIPMPAGLDAVHLSEAAFYNNLSAYQRELAGQPFDGAAFVRELDERIVTPLREAQVMVDEHPYLTRLVTLVSPEEMTRDPLFDFNSDLRPVSNVHTALGTGTCGVDGRINDVTFTFENGQHLEIPGPATPFLSGLPRPVPQATSEPAAWTIELMGPEGHPVGIARDRVKTIDQQLDSVAPALVREMARQQNSDVKLGGSGGCGLAGGRPVFGPTLLLFALLIAGRRRRRR